MSNKPGLDERWLAVRSAKSAFVSFTVRFHYESAPFICKYNAVRRGNVGEKMQFSVKKEAKMMSQKQFSSKDLRLFGHLWR